MALDHGHGPQAHKPTSDDDDETPPYAGKTRTAAATDQTNALTLHSAPGQVMGRDGLAVYLWSASLPGVSVVQ
jgi:hypothetical protein